MELIRSQFLKTCRQAIQKVHTQEWSVEEAAYGLISFLFVHDELRKLPEIDTIFDVLGPAEIPRESSHGQSIGSWNAERADSIKEAEWQEVVRAVERAEQQP